MDALSVEFRFYEELNDFLPPDRKKRPFLVSFRGNPSVKDTIEATGVPHAEVDLILANGVSVGFDYILKDGDRISVYPVFEGMDITPAVRLQGRPLRNTRFIADVHLKKLARVLRLLGFDTLYSKNFTSEEIVRLSAEEERILLTRQKAFLKLRSVTRGYWLRTLEPESQALEVLHRFDLKSNVRPFIRCLVCNGELAAVPKKDILNGLPPRTAVIFRRFLRCSSCGKVYWKGSHFVKLEKRVKQLIKAMAGKHDRNRKKEECSIRPVPDPGQAEVP